MAAKETDKENLAQVDLSLAKQSKDLVNSLASVARPNSVYSEPVTSGDYTVITASEVTVLVGTGYGVGSGTDLSGDEDSKNPSGTGGGGGGGGFSGSRPVAVITVGPNGVAVEPIVDATKLGLALFTAVGSMFLMFRRMRRWSR